MQQCRIIYLDAFTTTPFKGNPCAVVPDAAGLSDEQMQAIARETNLPETSFVFQSEKADYKVRYFTPRHEIPFAGHPTIATVFMLAQEGMIELQEPETKIELEFNIGVLPVRIYVEDGKPVRVVMTQQLPEFGDKYSVDEVAPCLNLSVEDLRDDCLPQVVNTGVPFLMVPVKNVNVLEKIEMDRPALNKLCEKANVPAAFVFSIGGFSAEADTHARFCDPNGTFEDPFTGSASGAMGAFVVRYSLIAGPEIVAEQGHFVNRPGIGVLEIAGSSDGIESVQLGGEAVKVIDGTLFIA